LMPPVRVQPFQSRLSIPEKATCFNLEAESVLSTEKPWFCIVEEIVIGFSS